MILNHFRLSHARGGGASARWDKWYTHCLCDSYSKGHKVASKSKLVNSELTFTDIVHCACQYGKFIKKAKVHTGCDTKFSVRAVQEDSFLN